MGIGFGGIPYEKFRIWLDLKIFEKSYISDEGNCYEKGDLSDCAT